MSAEEGKRTVDPSNVAHQLSTLSITPMSSKESEGRGARSAKLSDWGLKTSKILSSVSTKSIDRSGRSALSQRVLSRSVPRKYATPVPFPAKALPLTLESPNRPAHFGLTNHSRAESLAQFSLYRKELLESRGATNVMRSEMTFDFASPKSRGRGGNIIDRLGRSTRRCAKPKQLFAEDDPQSEIDKENQDPDSMDMDPDSAF